MSSPHLCRSINLHKHQLKVGGSFSPLSPVLGNAGQVLVVKATVADGWLIAGDPVCYLSCTEKLLATGHVSGPGSSWYRRRPWNSFQLDSLQIAMSVSPNIKTWNSKLRMSGLEVRTMMRTLPSHLWPERTEIQWTMSQLFQIPRYCLVLFHLYFNTDLFLNAVQNLIQIVPNFLWLTL